MSSKRIIKQSFSLLNTDYVQLDSKWNYANVISPYHRIYYIDGGEGTISDSQKKLKLEPGFLYLIPGYTLCHLNCERLLSQYFVQFFEESPDGTSIFGNARAIFKAAADDIDVLNFKRLITINPGRGINRSFDPRVYEKDIYYKQYQELNSHQKLADFLQTQGILLQLIARFSVPEIFHASPSVVPVKILEAMRFIAINLHQPLSVQLLADRCHLNPQYFSRLFEQHTGTRPQAYIIQKRIERAQHIILAGQAAYKDVAEMTGFKSLSAFSRSFKQESGMSPRDFKRQAGSLSS